MASMGRDLNTGSPKHKAEGPVSQVKHLVSMISKFSHNLTTVYSKNS